MRYRVLKLACLLAPMFFFIGLVFASQAPMFVYSFMTYEGAGSLAPIFTLENYVNFLQTPAYVQMLALTALTTLEATPLALILSYPIAYYIVRTRSVKLRRSLLVVVISMFFMSDIVRVYTFIPLLGRQGALNQFLTTVGLPRYGQLYSSTSISIGLANFLVPFAALILVGSIKAVDPNLEDAARNLGASSAQTFLRVTLPLTLPGIAYATMACIAIGMGAFVTPMVLGGGYLSEMANLIYNQMTANFNYALASAVSFLLFLMTFTLAFGFSNYFQRRIKRKWGI